MKKTLKIFISLVVAVTFYLIVSKVNAASAQLQISSTQINVGDTVNISVGVNAAAWEIHVSGCVNGNYSDTSSDGNNTSFSTPTLSFKPTEAGTYEVVLKGNVTDESSNNGQATSIGDKKSIIVTASQPTQPTQPSQPTEPAKPVEKTPTFANANKTMYTTGGCNLRSSWSTSSAATYVEAGTELKVTGISSESVNGYVWYRVNYNGTKYVANFLLTDTKPEEKKEEKKEEKTEEKKSGEKSTNKALKDLVVENYKLTPDFDSETTKYTLKVTKEVEELEITPIVQDNGAKYEITGNENFKVGNNIVKITVTAEDGTTRLYTITVTKTNEDGSENPLTNMLKLSKLQIKDIKLEPDFNPETTTYSILVADPSSIKITDVTAIAEDEDVEVTVAETEADENGNRIITIMLENADESKSGVYQIIVKKGVSAISELERNKNNRVYFILGGIIGILAIAIIVVIVLLKKTSDEEDFDDVKDADELSDDYAIKNEMDKTKSEVAPEFDEIIEDSNIKSQILTNQSEYDDEEKSKENFDESQKTKRFDLSDEFDGFGDEELKGKGKKKGKHF